MAAAPVFASVGRVGLYLLANSDSTTLTAAILTGVAAGTRIKEIRVSSGITTAPGTSTLKLMITDGTTVIPLDQLVLTNTVNIQQGVFRYDNVILPGTAWSIKAQMVAAITSGSTILIAVLGEDLT